MNVSQHAANIKRSFYLRLFAGGSFLFYLVFMLVDFFGSSSTSKDIKRKRRYAYKRYKINNSQIKIGEITNDSMLKLLLKQYQLYRNFLGDKLNKNGAALTVKDIEVHLIKIGIDTSQIEKARSLAMIMDKISFGQIQINVDKGQIIRKDIDHLVGAIEKKC